MSILPIDDYKLIQEEVLKYSDISERSVTLLVDLGWEEESAKFFVRQMEDSLDDADSVSFISAYKNYVIPKNFAGVALVKWLTPDEYTTHLAPSDFCSPIFLTQKGMPLFSEAIDILEEFIRLEAEVRQYSYELRESLNL